MKCNNYVPYSRRQRQAALKLWNMGMQPENIAEAVGKTVATVHRWCRMAPVTATDTSLLVTASDEQWLARWREGR